MSSAIFHTIYKNVTGNELFSEIDFKNMKNLSGCSLAKIKIKDRIFKIIKVNGIESASKVLEKIKIDPRFCDYLEVMACLGGCIGGGGQPLSKDAHIIKKRILSLSKIGKSKKTKTAHQNIFVQRIYEEYLNSKVRISSICYTKFKKRKRGICKILPPGSH